MKKNILLCFLTMLFSTCLFAREVFTMCSDEKIKLKVSEIKNSELKYKNFDNSRGEFNCDSKSNSGRINYKNESKELISNKPLRAAIYRLRHDKHYRAIIYAGPAMPIQHFSQNNVPYGGSAKLGGTIGHDGDVHLVNNIGYLTYNLSAAFNSYEIINSNFPRYYPTDGELKGCYITLFGLAGIKLKTKTNYIRLYAAFTGGLIKYIISGDLAGYTTHLSEGCFGTQKRNGKFGYAFCGSIGSEIKNRFNIGMRVIYSKPTFSGTYVINDTKTLENDAYSFSGVQWVSFFQLTAGFEF